MAAPVEIEVKIAVASAAKARKILREAKFHVEGSRVFERNLVLDNAQGSVKRQGLLLRIRTTGTRGKSTGALCTFKGPARETRTHHKIRIEREFMASDGDECLAVFAGVGLHPAFRYEKFRTKFSKRGRGAGKQGHIVLDETPIGVFLELEGPAMWIDRTAKDLGFSRNDYITMSYSRLWERWRAEHAIPAGDMVFDSARQRG
ncbi:MAG TPA: class IV adenylate cyclase [Bryobacteraceae bacterium]|nr:class IV adenylate cyclase [Bryobacteraceae bacterium]